MQLKQKVGRPPKYKEATTTVAFRVPVSEVPVITEFVRERLKLKLIENISPK